MAAPGPPARAWLCLGSPGWGYPGTPALPTPTAATGSWCCSGNTEAEGQTGLHRPCLCSTWELQESCRDDPTNQGTVGHRDTTEHHDAMGHCQATMLECHPCPAASVPCSPTLGASEHQPAEGNGSIASSRKWEADFQVRGTKMTCIT